MEICVYSAPRVLMRLMCLTDVGREGLTQKPKGAQYPTEVRASVQDTRVHQVVMEQV